MRRSGSYVLLLTTLLLLSCSVGTLAKEISFLTISYPGELTKYLQDEVIPRFKDEHGADVTMMSANWNTRMERIIVLTAAGTAPDVIVTGFYSPYEEGSLGMLEPLNRYLNKWSNTSKYSKDLWNSLSWRGEVMAVPQNLDFRGIGYNKLLYSEAGLDPEKPPQSWSEMTQYARRLTRIEGDKLAVRGFTSIYGTGGGTAQQLVWFLRQAGVTEINTDNFTSNLNRPEAVETLQALQELYEAGQNAMPVAAGGIVQGREAMIRFSPSNARSMRVQDPEIMDRVGVFAPRKDPNSRPVAHMFANGLAIPSASRYKDLAWEWISMLSSDEISFEIQNISGFFSGRLDMLHRMIKVQPGIEKWYAMDPYMQPQITPPPRDIAQQELTKAVCDVYDLKIAPRAALEQVHTLWTRLLGDWKEQIGTF